MLQQNNLKTHNYYNYECPEDLNKAGLCGRYFIERFNRVRTTFSNCKEGKYLNEIKRIEDPILRHVALYLVENFEENKQYLGIDQRGNNNIACEALNRWMEQKKSFYTYGNNCKVNESLWNETIEPIWNELNKENNMCKRKKLYAGNAYIPEQLRPLWCYKNVPQNYECTLPFNLYKNINLLISGCQKINDQCLKCKQHNTEGYNFPKTYPYTDANKSYSSPELQTSCKECPSKIITIALSICITFFGTLFILFFLYKFTPIGAKLSNGGRNIKNLQQQLMEEEEYEEYE